MPDESVCLDINLEYTNGIFNIPAMQKLLKNNVPEEWLPVFGSNRGYLILTVKIPDAHLYFRSRSAKDLVVECVNDVLELLNRRENRDVLGSWKGDFENYDYTFMLGTLYRQDSFGNFEYYKTSIKWEKSDKTSGLAF